MCMCMWMCYVCVWIFIRACVWIFIRAYVWIFIRACVWIFIRACVWIFIHACVCGSLSMHVCRLHNKLLTICFREFPFEFIILTDIAVSLFFISM